MKCPHCDNKMITTKEKKEYDRLSSNSNGDINNSVSTIDVTYWFCTQCQRKIRKI